MTALISYELGASAKFGVHINSEICWNSKNPVEGVKAWARNNSTGEYVRVFEVGPTEWVDGQPQAWSSGNFETVESAKKFASKAYRYINRDR